MSSEAISLGFVNLLNGNELSVGKMKHNVMCKVLCTSFGHESYIQQLLIWCILNRIKINALFHIWWHTGLATVFWAHQYTDTGVLTPKLSLLSFPWHQWPRNDTSSWATSGIFFPCLVQHIDGQKAHSYCVQATAMMLSIFFEISHACPWTLFLILVFQ